MSGVTVVIPHYGDSAVTLQLVRELKRQRTAPRVQIIVSDDASEVPFPDVPGVHVVRRTANGGFGAAVNSGAAAAEHEYLLILNSDITIEDSFVEDLVSAAKPWMPAVVSPWVTSPTGTPSWTGRHFPNTMQQFVEWLTPLTRWRDRRSLHEAVGHDTRARKDTCTVVDWVVGAALLIPTTDFRAVGGFDERFFMNSEEVDLQRRLRARGLPSVALGAPTVLHYGGGSSDPQRRRSWLVASRLAYAEKWGGLRQLQMALLVATGVNLVWNVGRRMAAREVRPLSIAREELLLIKGKAP